jgi:heme exporter protein CcmD
MFTLDMGKYAIYVWGAYGVTFVTLASLIVVSVRTQALRRKKLEALQAAVAEAKAEGARK